MDKKELRIVFMGTPEFAVESLKALVEDGFNVVGVVTAADKRAGRGKKIRFSAVKEYALEKGLNLLQPEKFKEGSFLTDFKELKADLQIVVAFRMLPEVVWNMPPLGTFNLHASLLPQYRGAAPINHAIINGETKTGLTTFFLDKKIDTGRIILQTEIPIDEDDSAGSLHDKMMGKGAKLVLDTVEMLLEGKASTIDQNEISEYNKELKPAPKIFKEDCVIDWKMPAKRIYDFIRGLSPYPAATTILKNENTKPIYLKVFSSVFVTDGHDNKIGSVNIDKHELRIAVTDGFVVLKEVQQAGKRRMPVSDFIRGLAVDEGFWVEIP